MFCFSLQHLFYFIAHATTPLLQRLTLLHTVSRKNSTSQLSNIAVKNQLQFLSKFCIIFFKSANFPPHLKNVTTLPCDTQTI